MPQHNNVHPSYITLFIFILIPSSSSSSNFNADHTTMVTGMASSPFLLLPVLLLIAMNCDHVVPPVYSSSLNNCGENKCGDIEIPFPYHLSINESNSSCVGELGLGGLGLQPHELKRPPSNNLDAFGLSCLNSTTLYLNIGSESYRVLEFYSDGVAIDFPGANNIAEKGATCREYLDLNSFGFNGDQYYGISTQNVLCLYDCEDSSVCKMDCDDQNHNASSISPPPPTCKTNAPYNTTTTSCTCCYPLSDPSAWQIGDGFSAFSQQYGCRGFSSWFIPPTGSGAAAKTGIKLEWAIPTKESFARGVCATNAIIINATTVKAGVRCTCENGFQGDGYLAGLGCFKPCVENGHEAYGKDCHVMKGHSKKKVAILAGVLISMLILTSFGVFSALVRRPAVSNKWDSHLKRECTSASFHKDCKTRLFKYIELEEATKGFEESNKIVDSINGTVHSGVLSDGTSVAVQKMQCENEQYLMQFLSRVEMLSKISQRHVARLLGYCIDPGYTPSVIYEFCRNGTLEEHLYQGTDQKSGIDWYQRLNIAAETASTLAFLQYGIVPPVYHHDLKSASIFLDHDFSVKIAGFGLLKSGLEVGSRMCHSSEGPQFNRSDVYDLGTVLLEIIAGSRHVDLPAMALPRIRNGKLEEIVDPRLYYHEQPPSIREQIEIVADLATRCLLFGGDGRLNMRDVARELVQMRKESLDGCRRGPSLDETFSNSSLLQMISMSPDSVYAP